MAGYIHKNALAFSLLMFGHNAMSGIFNFYYVKIFLQTYGISHAWFDVAQLIYIIWNAVNDPVCAYWQDNSKIEALRNRRLSILYGAPLYALSFLLPWFPWGDYTNNKWLVGMHLFVSMACYDALLTFVLLAYSALYAEISPKHEDRIRLTKYSQIAGLFGSSSVMIAEFLCDGVGNLPAFQMYVVFVAVISGAAMFYTGKKVKISNEYKTCSIPHSVSKTNTSTTKAILRSTFGQFWQIIRRKNFISFVATNFLQIFHTYYLSNFLAIFADELIPAKAMPDFFRKLLYGGSAILIPILVLCLSPLVSSKGYYKVVMWSFYLKVCFGVIMLMTGYQFYWMLAIFFLVDRTVPNAIFNFFNLPVSDIIDADQKEYKRSNPLSSSVFGYNALFTKPAQSLAPMMIVGILERNNYQDRLADDMSPGEAEDLKAALFLTACAIPVIVGLLQIVIWRPFSIRESHVQSGKTLD